MITRFKARTLFYAQVSYALVGSSKDTGDVREAKEVDIFLGERLKYGRQIEDGRDRVSYAPTLLDCKMESSPMCSSK